MKNKLLILLCLALSGTLSAETKVLAFAGSTRDGSYNKQLVKEAAEIARQMKAQVTIIDLKDYPMPFYDADLENREGMPTNAKRLRNLMINSDLILIASPQYNASISAVLKNAIDWTSRSEDGKSSHAAYSGKKFGIMSASPGKKGGACGLEHLRTVIEDCGGEVLQLQVTLGIAHTAFNAQGQLENAIAKAALVQEVQAGLQATVTTSH